MYRTIKIEGKLYDELDTIRKNTNIPLTKIIEFAFNEFKNSQKYAHLILFAKADFKIEKEKK